MKISQKTITVLLKDKSNKLWENYGFKRLYLDWHKLINFELGYFNTGNISSAYIDGEKISNNKARKYVVGKAWINLETKELEVKDLHHEMDIKVIEAIYELDKKTINEIGE
tara:strand:- start:1259 stop:1591 length:333 start_codon:yes stop_codon:yes gene_type:complete